MTAWTIFLAIGVGTYLLRVSMFVLLADRSLPSWTDTPLSLVAPAAIAALVASLAFTQDGRVELASMPELLAITAAFAATRRTGNVMHSIAVGLPVFWLATYALS